ncbi:hypothetical protein Q4485_13450 [Granulosicoccaceae sp. 1_MG-2023]|nr:hypothetical protein [Granulosicoccaceae sp. 1_MG-2023]
MADKSGGDIMQSNTGMQGNASGQDLNALGVGGAGAVDAMGGAGAGMGMADQAVTQAQNQANAAMSGMGGDDNINANTTINIS